MHGLSLLLTLACTGDTTVSTFNEPPSAAITSHESGEQVLPGDLEVLGTVNDLDGDVMDLEVSWLLGNTTICGPEAPQDTSGYTVCVFPLAEPGDAELGG